MEKILSISVASYMVEDYIRDTLESCIIPEIMDDIEVLVIVDGIGDRTPEIAKEFESRYPDTFRVIIKENGGYGTAVNRGVTEARGKYFKCLDGDDSFNKEGLKDLVDFLKETDADWIASSYERLEEGDRGLREIIDPVAPSYKMRVNKIDFYAARADFNVECGVWLNTIRTQILKDHLPKLPGKCNFTDELVNVCFLPYVKIFACTFKPVYKYLLRKRPASDSSRMKLLQNFIFIRKKQLESFGRMTGEYVANYRNYKYRVRVYYQKLIWNILGMKPSAMMLKELEDIESYCRSKAPAIYKAMEDKEQLGKKAFIMSALRQSNYAYPIRLMAYRFMKNYIDRREHISG